MTKTILRNEKEAKRYQSQVILSSRGRTHDVYRKGNVVYERKIPVKSSSSKGISFNWKKIGRF